MARSFARENKAKALAKVAEQQAATQAKQTLASKARSVISNASGLVGQAFDVVKAQFERHCVQLQALADVSEKEEFKKTIIAEYLEYLASYADSGEQHQNPVLSRVIFWLIDVGDIHHAMMYARLAIAQQQRAPEGFKRDLTTAVTEDLFMWAERQYKNKASAEPYLSEVAQLCLNKEWIVAEPIVLSKMYRHLGIIAEDNQDWATAITWFEHAETVNGKSAGVKTRMKKARDKLNPGTKESNDAASNKAAK